MKKFQFSLGNQERRPGERKKLEYVQQKPLEYSGLGKAHSKIQEKTVLKKLLRARPPSWSTTGYNRALGVLFGSPGRGRLAKLTLEVNQAEIFMAEDALYEFGKWIVPEAAIYL